MFSRLSLINSIYQKAQPLKRWAFVILAFAICALGALFILDGTYPSAIIIVPLIFFIAKLSREFILSILVFLAIALLAPHLQSIGPTGFGGIPLASLAFLIVPSWAILLIFFRSFTCKQRLLLVFVPVIFACLSNVFIANWVSPNMLALTIFRAFLSLAPLFLITSELSKVNIAQSKTPLGFFIAMVFGALSSLIAITSPVNKIIFDESHGKWETVTSPFTPNDFGRSANYTYSQLYKIAKNNYEETSIFEHELDPLPSINSVFVLKMPTEKLSDSFSNRLTDWVHRGGRLFVVADHTDLYDTTQNLNKLLTSKFSTTIKADAVYNLEGMPNNPLTPLSAMLIGKINVSSSSFPWQTGTSLSFMPLLSVELANYGLSFTEAGDYSRPNRFGTFTPSVKNRFLNHSSVIAFKAGSGAVALILDSTPWSNFSIFREPYPKLFKSIITSLESPWRLSFIGLSGYLALALIFLYSIKPLRAFDYFAGFLIGLTVVILINQSLVSLKPINYGVDYKLRVVLGADAKIEFLKQLLTPSDQNFSRIISALGKYDLLPVAATPSSEIPYLKDSKKWLIINPDSIQLPKFRDVEEHLSSGGNITILFAPYQARSPAVLDWLKSLSLFTQTSVGLKVSDIKTNESGSYLKGRKLSLGREVNVIAVAMPTSLLTTSETDQLFQSFTLRPTKVPRLGGLLTISFVSDQFNDDAIGDVWEGISPSSIGRLREKQLASIILEKNRPAPFPLDLVYADKNTQPNLRSYLVLEDGITKILGKLPDSKTDDLVVTKFKSLRDQAETFVKTTCPRKAVVTSCESRLLDESYVEWIVSWKSSAHGKIDTIELVSDRRFSGLNSSINVIFAQ
jgi:hypothetical protein